MAENGPIKLDAKLINNSPMKLVLIDGKLTNVDWHDYCTGKYKQGYWHPATPIFCASCISDDDDKKFGLLALVHYDELYPGTHMDYLCVDCGDYLYELAN
jgi:hypothetical protein